MRFSSLLLSAILLPALGAAELEYRFLPEKGGWHVSANTPYDIPEEYWYEISPEGNSVLLRAERNNQTALTLENTVAIPGNYTLSGELRSLSGPGARFKVTFGGDNPDYRVWRGPDTQGTPEAREAQKHAMWIERQSRELAADNSNSQWRKFQLTFPVPDAGNCPNCGRNRRFDRIFMTFLLISDDEQAMTRNMELELRNLKLTGPGEISQPPPTPKKAAGQKTPVKRAETAEPENPGNLFDARPMLKSGSMRNPPFSPAGRLTPEQLTRLNPDFSIRPIFRYPSEQERRYSRYLRFPPAASSRGPFAAATIYDGKFYGICRNGKQSELCEYDPASGKWRTLWRNTAPESIDNYPYGNGNVPLLHTGAVIWSGYGGIPANGGAPAPLPDFFRRPGTYALLGRQFYAAGPGPGQLLKFKPNGSPDQPLVLDRQNLPPGRLEGIWSYPDSRTLLVQAGSYLYEIQPATGAVRRKLQFHGIPRIIDTPLGHILTPRQDYPALLAVDGGPGQPFLVIAGPPNFIPGMRVLPGAADRNLPPKLKPLGLKGQYLLLRDECHRLLLINLVRPERSLMLRGIGFGRFHLSPDGNTLWLEGEDALYEIAPRGGWGSRPDSQEGITVEDLRLEQQGAARLDPAQALQQSFATDADLFRMRPIRQGERQVLEFTAAKVPFECRVSLQFNPELTAGKSLRLIFKPDDLARQLPALRVGEGANSGISPLAADGTVTLRSGSGLVELILEKSDQPVTFTIDTVLISKGKEFLR